METTLGSVSAASSPRGRRLATTVAALALCLAAGTAVARASGGVSWEQAVASQTPTVAEPPIYAPSDSAAYSGTPDNPLVRPWGVYQGPAEMPWLPYLAASDDQQTLLDKIVQRPKATWFGAWQPNVDITERVETYLELTTGGDPDVLAQITIFRMVPWERESCDRLPTAAEQASYYAWIDGFAAGVGDTHLAVVMQPDAPFGLCAPGGSQLPLHMIRYAVRKLSALANTSVYIEAGAADWLRDDPKEALKILVPAGIRDARGFALNGTHYDSTERQIRFAADISKALRDRGIPGKYAVINTAENGRPFKGYEYDGPNFDNARACTKAEERRCVTLGIPPTIDVASPQWGLPAADRLLADRYVDAYLWFGRPWLYNQAKPFDLQRALQLTRTTPYP
jgi:endoglucanase